MLEKTSFCRKWFLIYNYDCSKQLISNIENKLKVSRVNIYTLAEYRRDNVYDKKALDIK